MQRRAGKITLAELARLYGVSAYKIRRQLMQLGVTTVSKTVEFSERHLAQRRAGKITLVELAWLYGVSASKIRSDLIRLRVSGRTRGKLDERAHQRVLLLAAQGFTLQEIGNQIGVTRQRVHQMLSRHDITTTRKVALQCASCAVTLAQVSRRRTRRKVWCVSCLQRQPSTSFSQRLATYQLAAGFSREQLAQACRVQTNTVQVWERGEALPSAWALLLLARALKLSPEILAPEVMNRAGKRASEGQARREDLARQLKKLRSAAGLTYKQLATRCGVSPFSTRLWEQGRVYPSESNLAKLALALPIRPLS